MQFNHKYKSKNFRPRADEEVQFLVLHYTALPLGTTLGIFTNNYDLCKQDIELGYYANGGFNAEAACKGEVSAHYVNSEQGEIFQLVDEEFASYHAGVSYWNGVKNINNHSIGIEHENIGFDWLSKFPNDRALQVFGSPNKWCKFTEIQIEQTIRLCREIIASHGIKPFNIVGHSDIACGRKSDPGAAFPWRQLAAAGIGMWYDLKESTLNDETKPVDPVLWVQRRLAEYGYDCPITGVADDKFTNTLQAFQMHFRPTKIDGQIDLESLQILDSLCQRKARYEEQASMNAELAAQAALYDAVVDEDDTEENANSGSKLSFRC